MLFNMRIYLLGICIRARVCWGVREKSMLATGRSVGFLGRVCRMAVCVDCCHSTTELKKITDAGLKDFGRGLCYTSTITTVTLQGKYEWFVGLCVVCCSRVFE